MRLGLKVIGIATLLQLFSSLCFAQEYLIVDLRATGSTRYTEAAILKTSGLVKNKVTSLEEVRAAASTLAATGVFAKVGYRHVASGAGMKVDFTVKDRTQEQYIRVEFEDFVWFSDSELDTELRSRVPLYNGEVPLNGLLQHQVAAALQEMLTARGIPGEIAFRAGGGKQGAMLQYSVEGVPITIERFDFPGASAIMAPDLQKAAIQHLGRNYRRSIVPQLVSASFQPIYSRRGFLQANFGDARVEALHNPTPEKAYVSIAVSLPVTEGRTYTFAGIRWTGEHVDSAALDRILRIHTGDMVDGVQLDKSFATVRRLYALRGYFHMLMETKPVFDEENGTVRYEVAIDEGDLFKMGKFKVEGLDAASAEHIHQAWKMREGEPFNDEYIDEFVKNSFRLPPDTGYIVEREEGEVEKTVNITLRFCKIGNCVAQKDVLISPETGSH